MKKYIYHSRTLRCRITRTGYKNQMELRLQKKFFLFIWINCYQWMHVSEGFWGEDRSGRLTNPMTNSYRYGHKCESWVTGTFDIKKRVAELFKEYVDNVNQQREFVKQFKSL